MALAGANPLPGMEQVAVKRTDGFSIVADAGFWVYPPGRLFVFLVESWRKWRLQCSKNRRILPHPLFGHQIEHFPTISITTYLPFFSGHFWSQKTKGIMSTACLERWNITKKERMEVRFRIGGTGGCFIPWPLRIHGTETWYIYLYDTY